MTRKTETTWTNAIGQTVPISFVPKRDKQVTRLVAKHMKVAMDISGKIAALRTAVLDAVTEFVSWSESQNDVQTPGGTKGNINLTSFDGLTQIRVRKPEYIEFDERLEQAKTVMLNFLADFGETDQARMAIQIVTAAFTTTRDGRVRADAVLAVQRRVRIDHPTWRKAIALIEDSKQAVAAKTYVRFYRRQDTEKDFQLVTLNIADA